MFKKYFVNIAKLVGVGIYLIVFSAVVSVVTFASFFTSKLLFSGMVLLNLLVYHTCFNCIEKYVNNMLSK